MKGSLRSDLNAYVEKENTKFMTEYNHYNSNITHSISEEYIVKMSTLNFDTAKFSSDMKTKVPPFIPVLPSFLSFLQLDPKCSELSRWAALKAILIEKQVPYKVLEGETANFYYKELKDKIQNSNVYNLKKLELDERSGVLLEAKRKEYIVLCKCISLIQGVCELIQAKKYSEAMMTVNLLHEKMNAIRGVPDFGCYTFSSYLMVLMSMKLCSLIDMNLSRLQSKEVKCKC